MGAPCEGEVCPPAAATPARARRVLPWIWLLAGLVGATLLVAWSLALPKPVGSDTAVDRFSADRAMRIVRRLCDEIGMRPNGSPAQEQAAELLVDELRAIPGVEVEVQRVGGVQQFRRPPWPFPPFVYRTVNVVARLEGRTPEALLLDAHYDTLTDSVGAGDDAMAVGAMVETVRALAAGPKLERSIVLDLNGGEEIAMLGAAGFVQHRFAKDVRAYLYVDTGPRGRPVVIGAGPGNTWLLEQYAAAARSVTMGAAGQDLVDHGLLPHSGDFLPLREAGMVGIDIAAIDDFRSIHTSRDRPERIDRGALQLMGDNLLAGARRLATGELPGNVDQRAGIYYDVHWRAVGGAGAAARGVRECGARGPGAHGRARRLGPRRRGAGGGPGPRARPRSPSIGAPAAALGCAACHRDLVGQEPDLTVAATGLAPRA